MPHRLPVDVVIFEADALVGPAPGSEPGVAPAGEPGRARPGVRRLLDALGRAGATLAVQTDEPADRVARRLDDAGLGDLRERFVVGPAAELTARFGPDPARAHLVTAPDQGDGPIHHRIHQWLTGEVGALAASTILWAPLDAGAIAAAEERHLRLTKPPGSLGRLEAVGVQLAGIAAEVPPPVPRPAAVAVFAGDHGVHAQGVSPWPQEVTAQMVANFLAGGAAINVLARQAGAEVVVVDVGVAADLDLGGDLGGDGNVPGLVRRKVRRGTADLSAGPAMTREEAQQALDIGAEVAAELVGRGARCLVTGDMGIANTTPSAALIAALADRPAAAVTGHGAGLPSDQLARKASVVEAAAARARQMHGGDPLGTLAEVGGLEHAALAGFVIGGAALQVPVVVDGVIAAAALLVAARLVPGVERAVIAGHRSVEPGSAAVLGDLGLDPMVDLGLRLGEGTGAALALPLVEAAALVLDEMATFDQAGVSGKGQ
jgi:nicotinate-nucleotide--dimethylbenzimidazole phosphoribosyltransferase